MAAMAAALGAEVQATGGGDGKAKLPWVSAMLAPSSMKVSRRTTCFHPLPRGFIIQDTRKGSMFTKGMFELLRAMKSVSPWNRIDFRKSRLSAC